MVVAKQSTTPVTPVPSSRWGNTLQPAVVLEDFTSVTSEPRDDQPFSLDLDIEDNYLFIATGQGLQIWDISNPEAPLKLGFGDADTDAPFWPGGDKNFLMNFVDAPPNPDAALAVTGADTAGVVVWNTQSKTVPSVHYQDASGTATQVYAFRSGSTDYAYAIVDGDLKLYNLSAAANLNRCLQQQSSCAGVDQQINFNASLRSIDGAGNEYLAMLNGIGSSTSLLVYDTSSPAELQLRVFENAPSATDVAIWKEGNKFFLAYLAFVSATKANNTNLHIFDATCIRDAPGTCTPAGPITYNVTDPSAAQTSQDYLTFSRDGQTPFLYVGNQKFGVDCVPQREYVIDVSTFANSFNPASPPSFASIEITPNHPEGYFGWYYQTCPDPGGFRKMQPRRAKFRDGYLYRAANSFLDSHCYSRPGNNCDDPQTPPPPPPPPNGGPVANFSFSPASPTAGNTVQFTDSSLGSPTQWSWDFDGDSATDSTAQNPSQPFPNVGSFAVTLTVLNSFGSDSITRTVNVEPPAGPSPPGVEGVATETPAPHEPCSPIVFTATGVSGSPLEYLWTITVDTTIFVDNFESGGIQWSQTAGELMASNLAGSTAKATAAGAATSAMRRPRAETPIVTRLSTTNRLEWIPAPNIEPGRYLVTVEVFNDLGTATASTSIPIDALEPLAFAAGTVPQVDPDPPTSRSVQFHLPTQGATEWFWNWGDLTSSGWLSNADEGQNPVHLYGQGGDFQVQMMFRNNCGTELTSDPVAITVPDLDPFVANFSFFPPEPGVDQTIQLTDTSIGDIDTWNWDFGNNNSIDAVTQNTSTSFSTVGDHEIRLEIFGPDGMGGARTDEVVKTITVVVAPPPPPPPPPPPGGVEITSFEPTCPTPVFSDTCSVSTGSNVPFRAFFTGDPARLEADWRNNGNWQNLGDLSSGDAIFTSFPTGNWRPVIRALDGSNQVLDSFTSPILINAN